MNFDTRKRGAAFPLEKPLRSRLQFDEEDPSDCILTAGSTLEERYSYVDDLDQSPLFKVLKSANVAFSTLPDKRQKLFPSSPPAPAPRPTLAANERRVIRATRGGHYIRKFALEGSAGDDISRVDGVRPSGSTCWGGGEAPGWRRTVDRHHRRDDATVTELNMRRSSPPPEGVSEAASTGPWKELVQLKIDAMFATGPSTRVGDNCLARKHEEDKGHEAVSKAEGRMDVDADAASNTETNRVDVVDACYVCRGPLGVEGGDVLCTFCDRAACGGCSERCSNCETPHCSVCLAADFSSQFECYFCPPCHQDGRHDAHEVRSDRMED